MFGNRLGNEPKEQSVLLSLAKMELLASQSVACKFFKVEQVDHGTTSQRRHSKWDRSQMHQSRCRNSLCGRAR